MEHRFCLLNNVRSISLTISVDLENFLFLVENFDTGNFPKSVDACDEISQGLLYDLLVFWVLFGCYYANEGIVTCSKNSIFSEVNVVVGS